METKNRRPAADTRPILWICPDCEGVLRKEGYILIRAKDQSRRGCEVCEREADCWPIVKIFSSGRR